jgi:hypothetical protein
LPDLRQQEVFQRGREVIPCETLLVLLRALIRLVYIEANLKMSFDPNPVLGFRFKASKYRNIPGG